ncbi:Origin recognition complex, subunit 1 [Apophysomyces ossiformis]|uniref:Cell division control protein n=1 Tax=Apophysomyces ossiformis TaxID=679940 RepID=A0A8H7BJE8_9FUNG|nr:Origin recognition complex, subunit 1 [Apophysomyces ossiformis]
MPRQPLAAAGKRSAARVNYAEESDSDDDMKQPRKRTTRRSTRRSKEKDDPAFGKAKQTSSSSESEAEKEEEEQEEEELPKRKPRSKLLASLPARRRNVGRPATTQKTVSKKPTIAPRSVHRLNQHHHLPIVPLRRLQQQERNEPLSPYELARERLHVSAVPESLPCREDEFAEIMGYLEGAIEEGTGMCVYISGVPGTGKTATVLEIIRHLQYQAEQKTLPEFDFVEINGMKLTDPNQAYSILWECLDRSEKEQRKRVTSAHALQLLEARFSTAQEDQRTTVVLMDELDLLVTKKQTVMYNFFEWPNRPFSKLIVVAVANTMDLPERMLSNKISSRMGLTRINFQPYTHQQLYQIVESRLQGIDAFEKDAMEFAARKVSAVSGDARRALDICRRAVEIVEMRQKQQQALEDNQPKKATTTNATKHVTIGIINEAIREMFSSPSVAFIQSCSLHQKLFLVSVMLRARRAGIAEVEFGDAALIHMQACKWHLIEPPTTSDLMRVCESLGQTRALVVENGRMDLGMRITLNLMEEDIKMACKTDKVVGKLLTDT